MFFYVVRFKENSYYKLVDSRQTLNARCYSKQLERKLWSNFLHDSGYCCSKPSKGEYQWSWAIFGSSFSSPGLLLHLKPTLYSMGLINTSLCVSSSWADRVSWFSFAVCLYRPSLLIGPIDESSVHTELIFVSPCWLAILGASACWSP